MTTQEKKNYCTPQGDCTFPDSAAETACRYHAPSVCSGHCFYRIMFADKCLSPFALTDARGQAQPVMPPEFPVLRAGMDF